MARIKYRFSHGSNPFSSPEDERKCYSIWREVIVNCMVIDQKPVAVFDLDREAVQFMRFLDDGGTIPIDEEMVNLFASERVLAGRNISSEAEQAAIEANKKRGLQ